MNDNFQPYGKIIFHQRSHDLVADYSSFHQAELYFWSADERPRRSLCGWLLHVRHWFLGTDDKHNTNDQEVEQAWRTMESN